MADSGRAPHPVGLVRRKGVAPCGLCGEQRKLTKTHVPPQAAGNTGTVRRHLPVTSGGTVIKRLTYRGGLWVRGLCQRCNNFAGRYDGAYAQFANAVRQAIPAAHPVALPTHVSRFPDVTVRPAAVARSILIAMHALAPHLRQIHPAVAAALIAGDDEIELPRPLRLRLATTRSSFVAIAGPIGGVLLFHPTRPQGRALGVMSLASVYFAPLAWNLADESFSWLDMQAWADGTNWLTRSPGEEVPLRQLVRRLPEVQHPRVDAEAQHGGWMEFLSDEVTFYLDGEIVSP